MSAFIVPECHIDFLLAAGLRWSRYGPLGWLAPHEARPSDYERGEVQGPTALASYRENARELTEDTADATGQMLLAENYRSVHHRYDERPTVEAAEPYSYREPAAAVRIEPVRVLKALRCFEYQSCEHAGWEASEARAFCAALREAAIVALPGYAESDGWSLDFPRGGPPPRSLADLRPGERPAPGEVIRLIGKPKRREGV